MATFHLPHGPAGTARGRVLHGLYRYHRRRMAHVDRCIALSTEQRDLLVRAGYPRSQVTVIPNAVDTDAVRPGPSGLRSELQARLVILYVGRLDPEKRVPALVESFLSLRLPGTTSSASRAMAFSATGFAPSPAATPTCGCSGWCQPSVP